MHAPVAISHSVKWLKQEKLEKCNSIKTFTIANNSMETHHSSFVMCVVVIFINYTQTFADMSMKTLVKCFVKIRKFYEFYFYSLLPCCRKCLKVL